MYNDRKTIFLHKSLPGVEIRGRNLVTRVNIKASVSVPISIVLVYCKFNRCMASTAIGKIDMKVLAVAITAIVALVYLLIPAEGKKDKDSTKGGAMVTEKVSFSII